VPLRRKRHVKDDNGAKKPGVCAVSVYGAHLVAAVPDRDDVVPSDPVYRTSLQAQPAPAAEALAAVSASADLPLTLVTLDAVFVGADKADESFGLTHASAYRHRRPGLRFISR
jgi:hypothetical protein